VPCLPCVPSCLYLPLHAVPGKHGQRFYAALEVFFNLPVPSRSWPSSTPSPCPHTNAFQRHNYKDVSHVTQARLFSEWRTTGLLSISFPGRSFHEGFPLFSIDVSFAATLTQFAAQFAVFPRGYEADAFPRPRIFPPDANGFSLFRSMKTNFQRFGVFDARSTAFLTFLQRAGNAPNLASGQGFRRFRPPYLLLFRPCYMVDPFQPTSQPSENLRSSRA